MNEERYTTMRGDLALRDAFNDAARQIVEKSAGRTQSVALTKLDEALMWVENDL